MLLIYGKNISNMTFYRSYTDKSLNISVYNKQKQKQWLKMYLEKKCMVDLLQYINFKLLINSKFGSKSGRSK